MKIPRPTGNIRLALESIKAARWRSFLTMLGVIIGVVSVVTTVSLGEGVKREVSGQITHLGSDLITIRPGKIVNRDAEGNITGVNLFSSAGSSTLTEADVETVRTSPKIRVAVPTSLIAGNLKADQNEVSNGYIIATTEKMPDILNRKVEFGAFFKTEDLDKKMAVIGTRVAARLFGEYAPVGKTIQIRGQDFIVRGVLEEFESNTLAPESDFNSAVFIPYSQGKALSGGSAGIYQILAKGTEPSKIDETVAELTTLLRANHAGQEDFTILKQSETLELTNNILGIMTSFIAGIAGISLLVGGIGIMNIMLVSVMERTREIGVRKAVGATNRQIMMQFLTEAIVISIMGGLLGISFSVLINFLFRIATDLKPVITLPVVVVSVVVSVIVGVIFGIMPAAKASLKDPIDALRYE